MRLLTGSSLVFCDNVWGKIAFEWNKIVLKYRPGNRSRERENNGQEPSVGAEQRTEAEAESILWK